jgi:outer membrane protein assembly factor BamB
MRGRPFSWRAATGSSRVIRRLAAGFIVALAVVVAACSTVPAGAGVSPRAQAQKGAGHQVHARKPGRRSDRPGGREAPAAGVTAVALATYLGDSARDGYYRADTALTPADVPSLSTKWVDNVHSVISDQPVTYAGVVYFGAWNGYEYAVRASNGKVLWRTYLGRTVTPPSQGCSPAVAGVASTATVARVDGALQVVTGTGNGKIASLDAATGKIAWQRRVAPVVGGFEWSSPAVFEGSVYIGVSSFGDCPLVPGRMMMLNARTGVVQHEFTTPLPKGCSGDGMWSSPAVDAQRHELYITTGNANTSKGKNCYSEFADALLGLSTTDVSLEGRWQIPKRLEFLNADFGATPTLFSATVGGKVVDLVGAANKDGVFYALRRGDLGAGPLWSLTVANSGDCPDCGEGSISPAAFDGTNLFVAGGHSTVDGKPCNGSVRSLDPATGKIRWARCLFDAVLAPVTETRGVVYVEYGPELNAIGAASGKLVFRYFDPVHASIFYGPITPSGGSIYVGSTDGRLRAFALKT